MALTPASHFWSKPNPHEKKGIKDSLTKHRREIEAEGLEEIKRAFNRGADLKELDEIDYYKDRSFIKREARQRMSRIDYIERRCSGGRLRMADYY